MNSLEINDKKAQLKERCRSIINSCKEEIREMTDEEMAEFEQAKAEIMALNQQLQELKKKLEEYEMPDDDVMDDDIMDGDSRACKTDEEKRNINTNISTNKEMNKNFSLIKAIRDVANNRSLDDVAYAVNQKGAEQMRSAGLAATGQIQLPTEQLRAITVESDGEHVVATDVYDVIEPLRARNVLLAAGAKMLTGLVGNVQLPKMSVSNVNWEGETAPAQDGAGSFTSVKLMPKRLTAYIDLSKKFLQQDGVGAENVIRQDLINAINAKLESTILGAEAGSDTKPAGIFYNNVATAATTDFAGLTEIEAKVESENVLGECKYIMSPKAKAKFRAMQKSAKTTQLVMEGGQIDGTEVLTTTHIGETNFAYGDWSSLVIGQFGGIDLVVDNFSKATDGLVRVIVNAYFDAAVVEPKAFAFGKA